MFLRSICEINSAHIRQLPLDVGHEPRNKQIFGIGAMVALTGTFAQFASILLQQGLLGAPLIGAAAGLILFALFLNEGFE